MPRLTVSTAQLGALTGVLHRIVRFLRRVALVGVAGAAVLLAVLADDGVGADEAVAAVLLLAPAAVVLLFAQGVRELAELPDRLQRLPGEGQERVAELTRLAGDARSARARSAPLLLWRLRGSLTGVRDLAGIAFPLRVFTPVFLGLAAAGALLCVVIAGVALIALLVTAVA
jgi:hypothetical protein